MLAGQKYEKYSVLLLMHVAGSATWNDNALYPVYCVLRNREMLFGKYLSGYPC